MVSESLREWALIAEIAGGVAIIMSLVFVGIQLKKNTRATRSAMAMEANAQSVSFYMGMGSDANLSGLFYRYMTDFDSLAQEEKFQIIMYHHSVMLLFKNRFYLVSEGTLDPKTLHEITESVLIFKDRPGWQYYWENRRQLFRPEFRAFIDELMQDDREFSQSLY